MYGVNVGAHHSRQYAFRAYDFPLAGSLSFSLVSKWARPLAFAYTEWRAWRRFCRDVLVRTPGGLVTGAAPQGQAMERKHDRYPARHGGKAKSTGQGVVERLAHLKTRFSQAAEGCIPEPSEPKVQSEAEYSEAKIKPG